MSRPIRQYQPRLWIKRFGGRLVRFNLRADLKPSGPPSFALFIKYLIRNFFGILVLSNLFLTIVQSRALHGLMDTLPLAVIGSLLVTTGEILYARDVWRDIYGNQAIGKAVTGAPVNASAASQGPAFNTTNPHGLREHVDRD